MIRKIYNNEFASVCFFRSTVEAPNMKMMLQITEKCNLRCKHCFVEAEDIGRQMSFDKIKRSVLPKLINSSVKKITLTGGEPLCHPEVEKIVFLLLDSGISVSICTNGTLIKKDFINKLKKYNNIHFNVSLDGFSKDSHGKFRGNMSETQFQNLIYNIRLLGKNGLLNGILVTPNHYCSINEYVQLCDFSKRTGANYVLMNPLSPFGRGSAVNDLAYSREELIELREKTKKFNSDGFEIVYIRFPNVENLPIGKCEVGSIPYIFCNGDISICPYMVFAADNETNDYKSKQFIIGNIFDDIDIKQALKNYKFPTNDNNGFKCQNCNNGCLAIKISNNQLLSDPDYDIL